MGNGSLREKIGMWGVAIMRISISILLFTVFGCFNMSSGEGRRNTCKDEPPKFDDKKINPGMYKEKKADASTLPVIMWLYHSNGIVYNRTRNHPDGTPNPVGPVAVESWDRYVDSGTEVIGDGTGEARSTTVTGEWATFWTPHGGVPAFFKDKVTPNSFQTVRKQEIRDKDDVIIDCRWVYNDFVRVGDESSPWPTALNWPEAWPDSVKRN